jgi:hypothetical protein
MLKQELREALAAALDRCDAIASGDGRLAKAAREELAAFVTETREALARTDGTAGEPSRITWRIAVVENPKTGRPVVLEVRADGGLVPGDQKRTGIDHAKEWYEVRATSRTEARALIEAGEATLMRRNKGRISRAELENKE